MKNRGIAAGMVIGMLLLSGNVTSQEPKFIGADNPAWSQHVQWALGEQVSCQAAVDDISPCNRFVGRALKRIWGITDFQTGASPPGDYMLANGIVTALLTMKDEWIEIGRANDQSSLEASRAWANKGYAVIAVRPDTPNGHVALILPGPLSASAKWGLNVPNSASFFYLNPDLSYIGKPLSSAFSSDKKGDVKLYYRLK
ncbi:hypothetical protein [Polaromonas sp.]|uniref:hypothetical protein n=1 Tax=Polaromonas sp. TaxID=1869339 RepID=UPI0032648429